MFRSLHMKLMLIMTLLIVSLMTVVGAFLVNSVSGYYLNQFYSQMQVVFQNDADFFHDRETAGPEEEPATETEEQPEESPGAADGEPAEAAGEPEPEANKEEGGRQDG